MRVSSEPTVASGASQFSPPHPTFKAVLPSRLTGRIAYVGKSEVFGDDIVAD